MKTRSLSALALLLATLANTAVAGNAIDGTYAMTMEAMGVQVRSATVELTPQYIREGDNKLAIAEWVHKDGFVTARDSKGAALLHARIENGGDTLIQQIEGIGTATFTRID
ncbi:hypothetical protein SAMN05216229_111138 [Geopseudomonas sagittaria]|uniref:Uncharacterized protein n=1 Tax=Geopseudomonas sagittaria TaxID=1135990 RepID=A0A1I5VTL2_9GAMM|nr:hypothetical protein [Pseudomonas sagittaria]SFQ10839.1 hypothetical protein SAMN05216229_111138 [Pseudomonas sagittaria]